MNEDKAMDESDEIRRLMNFMADWLSEGAFHLEATTVVISKYLKEVSY